MPLPPELVTSGGRAPPIGGEGNGAGVDAVMDGTGAGGAGLGGDGGDGV